MSRKRRITTCYAIIVALLLLVGVDATSSRAVNFNKRASNAFRFRSSAESWGEFELILEKINVSFFSSFVRVSGGKRGEERNKEERLERACDLTNSIIKFARLLPVHGATLQRLLHWPSRFIRGGEGDLKRKRELRTYLKHKKR